MLFSPATNLPWWVRQPSGARLMLVATFMLPFNPFMRGNTPTYMSPLVANIRLITFNLTLKLRGFSKYFDSYMGPVEHKIWWENGWKVGQEVSGVEFGIFPSVGVKFCNFFIWFCYSLKQLGLVLVYLQFLKKQVLLSWTVLPFKTGKFGNSIIISKYILLLTKT